MLPAELKGHFSEGSGQTFDLTAFKSTTVDHYLNWLYSGRLLSDAKIEHSIFEMLFDIYYFGERYSIPQLKRAAITRINELCHGNNVIPPEKLAHQAATTLPERDPLVRWLVDLYVARFHTIFSDVIDEDSEDVSKRFLINLLNRMSPISWSEPRWGWNPPESICEYHEHKTEVSREKCQALGKIKRKPADIESCERYVKLD